MGRGRGAGALDNEDKAILGGCCVFLVLLASCLMLGFSFDTLVPRRYGLRFDAVTLHVEPNRVYENGRYFVGLGRQFIEFPRYAIYLEFSNSDSGGARNGAVEAWTNDGQSIVLSIGFYYRLRKEGIEDKFFAYQSESWRPIVEDVSAAAFRDVATQFTAGDFFTARNAIAARMRTALQARLDATYAMAVDVVQFNFLSVEIPELFEDAVEARVVVSQQVETIAGPFRQSNLTVAEIAWIGANATRARRIVFADANAQAAVVRAAASANALESFAGARGAALAKLGRTLGWSANSTAAPAEEDRVATAQRLLRYQWYKTVQQNGGAAVDLLVNYPKTVLQA